jgi:hypothetical protein
VTEVPVVTRVSPTKLTTTIPLTPAPKLVVMLVAPLGKLTNCLDGFTVLPVSSSTVLTLIFPDGVPNTTAPVIVVPDGPDWGYKDTI